MLKRIIKKILPGKVSEKLWLYRQKWLPPSGLVFFGNLRRLKPIAKHFVRGLPIDRYYEEMFLHHYREDIRGHVLEIGDDRYTKKFGGKKVERSDVLHVQEGNPNATIIADLTKSEGLTSEIFDCIICSHTLQFIYDVKEAVKTLYRILKPGGVLLAAGNGITKISRYDMERWGEYWHFTSLSTRLIFQELFPPQNVTVKAYGNVLAAVAFLHGIAAQELRKKVLDYHDPDYEILIAIRAVKPKKEGKE